jgi:hypothetical protein
MLRDVLDVEIPSGLLPGSAGKFRKLADLDKSIWQTPAIRSESFLTSKRKSQLRNSDKLR